MSGQEAPALSPAEHFVSLEQQGHAARLGMWVFLASEVLLFAGLFTLLAYYRAEYPASFAEGVRQNDKVLGSINTGLLLTSSAFAATAVQLVRLGKVRAPSVLLGFTVLLGLGFLTLKFHEYGEHFKEGIYPGGQGAFFASHHAPGLPLFFTLYFLTTGLHALHVTVGMGVVGAACAGVARGKVTAAAPQRLEVAALYWHLVDVIWIFLWPILYLA